MKFLRKHKKQDKRQQPGSIAAGIKRLQGNWAAWMAKRTAGYSRRRWQVLLLLFILGSGGYSGYLIVTGFNGSGKNVFSITPIRKPTHATETGDGNTAFPQVSRAEHIRIRRFRLYMDSLARSPAGKVKYDSITRHRPGLMDSVRIIDNYYGQFKNK